MRSCSKTACPREASASCAFNYAARTVWLSQLRRDPDPNVYDLCDEHAASLRVPKGWSLTDERLPVPPDGGQPPLVDSPAPMPS